jgi:hypothetical protein
MLEEYLENERRCTQQNRLGSPETQVSRCPFSIGSELGHAAKCETRREEGGGGRRVRRRSLAYVNSYERTGRRRQAKSK